MSLAEEMPLSNTDLSFEIRVQGPLKSLWEAILRVWGYGQVGPIVSREKFTSVCAVVNAWTTFRRQVPAVMQQFEQRRTQN